MKKPTLGSLFDGSGGFPLAAALCGIEPVWASEVEPYPIAVTKTHLPKMKHLGSVTDIDGGKVEPVNIITFGSPCQDLSVAGKRAGLKHEANGDDETTRSGLFMEAVRIIKEMREATDGRCPNVAVWENVPGAFSSNHGEDFRTVLEELIKIVEPTAVMPEVPKGGWAYADCYVGNGWSLAYRVLDAQYIRTAQRRRRIFLVLHLTGKRAGEILFERESLRWHSPQSGTPRKAASRNVADGIGADNREGTIDVIQINTMVATRHKQLGRGTGFGVGEVGDPQFTISAGHEHACAYIFYPQIKAESVTFTTEKSVCLVNGTNPGFQNGVVTAAGFKMLNSAKARSDGFGLELSPTLSGNKHDVCAVYDTRGNGDGEVVPTITGDHKNRVTDYTAVAVEHVYCLQGNGIDRADTAGCNGRGWNDETCYTLNTIDRPAVAYSFDSLSSNSMKSSNPNSGCRQVDAAKCLDTTGPNPCKNQGGIAVVEQVPYTLKIRSGCEGGGQRSFDPRESERNIVHE